MCIYIYIYISTDVYNFITDPTFNLESATVPGCGSDGDLLQCHPGHPHCYDRKQACVYDTMIVDEVHRRQVQTSCRDGSHLRNNCGK